MNTDRPTGTDSVPPADRAARRRPVLRTIGLIGALLAITVAAWPALTTAQDDPGTQTQAEPIDGEGAQDGPASPDPTISTTGDDDATAAPPGTTGPTMTYIEGDLEIGPNGDFGTVIEVVDAPAGSDLAVQIYDRITTVEQLEASTTDVPANLLATFDTIPLAVDDPPSSQLSGFTISLYAAGQPRPPDAGAWAYRLDEPGVYPVRVRLRGPEGEQLDSFVTYLARTATSDPAQSDDETGPTPATQVALLARIHEDPPAHDDDSTSASIVDRGIDDERLLAIDRFITTLTDRALLPVSISITPDTARRMHDNGSSRPTAERVRAALVDDGRVVLSAPYVDVDPRALVDADLTDELDSQIMLGVQHLEQAIGRPGNAMWLLDRPIDAATVDALATRALDGLVVTPEVLADVHLAPVLVDGVESTLTVIPLFETGLTETSTTTGGDPNDRLAAHHAVGRLAALRGIQPDGAAVAVSVDPDVDPGRLDAFLDAVEATPDHIQLATVDRLLERSTATRPAATARPAEGDDPTLAAALRSTRSRVDSYRSMLPADSPSQHEFDLPLAISLDADRDAADRRADIAAVDASIERRFGSITTPERDRVTLGTRDATFPLPIATDSDEPLQVRIDIQASDRVELPRSSFETTLTGERTVVQIPVRTRASGDTALLITVTTPDGEVLLAESRYTIRSTAVSGVGVVLTIGAGGFLAVWWGRHWYRTSRARRSEARHARSDRSTADADL